MARSIRFLKEEDFEELVALDARGSNVPFGRKGLLGELRSSVSRCSIACSDSGTLCAFLLYHLVKDEAHILNIVVDQPYRRQGIARQLMNALMKSEISTIFLEVRSKNTAARSMYMELGFTSAGHRKDYYSSPVDDAILMTWVRQ